VASGLPRVELPILGAQQFASPNAVEAGGANRIDPILERDFAAAGPNISAALLNVAPFTEAVQRVAKIDAEDVLLVETGDFIGMRAAVPKMVKIQHQADVRACGFVHQFDLLLEAVQRREGERLQIESNLAPLADLRQRAQVLGSEFAHLRPGLVGQTLVGTV